MDSAIRSEAGHAESRRRRTFEAGRVKGRKGARGILICSEAQADREEGGGSALEIPATFGLIKIFQSQNKFALLSDFR
jgi:hypothetical protein